jgi:hypothetical protein
MNSQNDEKVFFIVLKAGQSPWRARSFSWSLKTFLED